MAKKIDNPQFDPSEFMRLMTAMVQKRLADFRQEIKEELKKETKNEKVETLPMEQLIVETMAKGGTDEGRPGRS